MTNQKYKLVPVEPTAQMINAAAAAAGVTWDVASRATSEAIAAAPEPVCRWKPDREDNKYTDCGILVCWTDYPTRRKDRHCFNCGKKVEVVGDE